MEYLRVAVLQTAWTDRDTVKTTYQDLISEASRQDVQMVCLQEFSISPYFASTTNKAGFAWAEPLYGGPSDEFFGELARAHQLYIVASIFERTDDERYFDTATIHNPRGDLAHFTRKVHIPSGEGYHEDHFFEGASDYPIHNLDGVRIAVPTCYDQWFPETARICALNGVDFIFYPSAIGSEPTDPDFDSSELWQTVMRGHAIANGIFIGAANRVGEENGIRFYGSSFICDPTGQVLAQASRDQTDIIIADLDPDIMTRYRNLFPLLHQRRPHTYSRILEPVDEPPPQRWQDGGLTYGID